MARTRLSEVALRQNPNIWVELSAAIAKYNPINLAHGFPDYNLCADIILRHLGEVCDENASPHIHQYTRTAGHPRLVQALSKLLSHRFQHDESVSGEVPEELRTATFDSTRLINPLTEILISVGGYGCLSALFQAIIDPGDEVVVIEPAFDCYAHQIRAVGGNCVCVPLVPPKSSGRSVESSNFAVDWTQLESKITVKTKMLLFNTPSNPLGKVYSREELKRLTDICIRHNLVCLADEVYEWLVYPPHKHYKIASFPGMWERTVTVGSGGKAFGVTGWRIGWTVGPEIYINAMHMIQQNIILAVCTPLQEAIACIIEDILPNLFTKNCFFRKLSLEVKEKRDRISRALTSVGMNPVIPQAGFFMLAEVSNIDGPTRKEGDARSYDVVFNEWMMVNKKLAGVPPTAFLCREHRPLLEKYIRFCILKHDDTIAKVETCLVDWLKPPPSAPVSSSLK